MSTQHTTPAAASASTSQSPAIAGLELREITGQAAQDTLVTDFGALALVPMEASEFSQRLCRAGFASPRSARSSERAAQEVAA